MCMPYPFVLDMQYYDPDALCFEPDPFAFNLDHAAPLSPVEATDSLCFQAEQYIKNYIIVDRLHIIPSNSALLCPFTSYIVH